jgi:hypothetical protein
MKPVQYTHHGVIVWVDFDLIGKHKKFCLCYNCSSLVLEQDTTKQNCPIAQELFEINKKYNIVTPVWECPEFKVKKVK